MDSIEAKYSLMLYNNEHLCVFVNGVRLDELLSEVNKNYLGLVPALLDWYDENFTPSVKEKEYVWNQVKLENGIKILPILLCPDDFDFSCTTIVVEVIDNSDTVVWNRFGADITEFSADEVELPKYIGKKIEWFHNIKPFIFSKKDYLKCIDLFKSNLAL